MTKKNEKLEALVKPVQQLNKLALEVEALCTGYHYPCSCSWAWNQNNSPAEDMDILF